MTLTWNGVPGVTSYTIQWSTSSTFATVSGSAPVGSAATTYTTGSIARQAWYFRIGSVNLGGTNWSAPVSVAAAP